MKQKSIHSGCNISMIPELYISEPFVDGIEIFFVIQTGRLYFFHYKMIT